MSGQPEVAASIRGVRVQFAHAYSALKEIDLDLVRGTITALAGPNGAGKTTLLRVLAGLQEPDSGTVVILGLPPERDLRRRVGYIPQDVALDPEMTGREILLLMAALHGVPRRERPGRVAELARAFGCTEHLRTPVVFWSGGLKRRLHLAAGMIHDPEILLLDEPTAGLDLEGADFLWAELERRAVAGRAVAIVTHDLPAVERHARQVAILDRGRLVALGPPQEIGGGDLAAAYRRLTGTEPETPAPGRRRRRGEE